ncbi:PTS transporter subunit EIIC [Cellulomonas denverensis]|uniref:PTS transporter subunit EIIC n=1 Tax=Cellulomonas denverensis TaxID=264297 RepID=A0A7X6KYM4_9CELL|nr:PTS transporter subunit EIIC [Cellulomonas denverensis]NKY24470.1 PTS transporter subunit EIIC [Cellulomonas denverensis]GIG25387.1 permease [Cellulomonas denverensis]
MDYSKLSAELLPLAGGSGNISSFTNCMTRLRLDVVDQSRVDADAIKALPGVLGVVEGPQLQVIVGPGHAQRLRDAFAAQSELTPAAEVDDPDTADAAADLHALEAENKGRVKARQRTRVHTLFRHIGNIFIPIIPGFIACGLILAIANVWKLISPDVVNNAWYLAFAALGGIVVGALNLVVGYNTAKEFGGTPILGVIAGAVPYLPALGGIVAAEGVEAQPLTIPLFGELKPALGGIIGVIATAWVFTVIEKQVRKRVPASLDLFVVPVITVLVGSAACVFIVMPLSALLMQGINWLLIDFALEQGGIIGGYLLASLFLPLVMLGIHQGLTPLHAQLITDHGFTELLPVLAMAGAGEVGMAIAIYIKTKSPRLKGIIRAALPIGVLGVGEPLIYGVSLPLFYPLITACLGGGFGGAFVAWGMQVSGGFGAGALGLSGVLMTAVISNGQWLWYVGGLLVSYVMGFLLTYFFGFKEHMVERLG